MANASDDAHDVDIEVSPPTASRDERAEATGAPKIFIGSGSAVDLSETQCSLSFPDKLVGKRIEVAWKKRDGDEKLWFPCLVGKFNATKYQHRLYYDDGSIDSCD